MADTTYTTDKEPATVHDVTEGGIIGAVGGAIVGGLAGGPIGAVIGAVAGGAASAGVVDVVDKRDNDYARTVYRDEVDTDDEIATSDTVVTDDLSGDRVVDTTVAPATTYTTTPVRTAYNEREAVGSPVG